MNRLAAVLGGLPPLNMWVRTAPRDAEHFCWRIELMPRLAQLAGLELGAGVHLNVLAPEDAAAAAARGRACSFRARRATQSQRPMPLFAAEPPQEPLPYGRWADALYEHFERRRRDRDRGRELVPRPHPRPGGPTCPATAPAEGGGEVFGFVSYTREHEGAQAPTSRRWPTSPTRPPARTPTGRSTSPTRRSAIGAAHRAGAA